MAIPTTKSKISLHRARIRRIILFLALISSTISGFGQPEMEKPARILFLLDASSSMLDNWTSSESRFKAASRIISAITDSIHKVNSDVAFAVRVFGSQYPAQDKNCYDSRLEVSFSSSNAALIRTRLNYLTPRGFSPIAWSLKETAENDFKDNNQYAYSIILITDGGESCGGDICATVTNLLERKISFKPYILSLVDYEPLKQQYDCMGKYLLVAKEKDIVPAINTIINDNRKILSIKTPGLRSVNIIKPAAQTVVKAAPVPPIIIKEEPTPLLKKETSPALPVIKKEEPAPIIRKEPTPVIKKEEPEIKVVRNEPVKPTPEELFVLPVPQQVSRIISQKKLRRLNMLYTLAEAAPVKVPRLMVLLVEQPEPKPPVVPSSTPVAIVKSSKPAIVESAPSRKPVKPPVVPIGKKQPTSDIEENLDFVSKTEEAKESTLQVYFTNGQGKFYLTEPKMVLRDSKTKKEIKSVFRNVSGGEPDPIKLPAGTYDIAIPGGKGKAANVTIGANTNKKIYIKINKGALAFYYPTAPNRPVKEYLALVSKRFEGGPVVKHRCDEELPYDPANYHIEINTLPPLVYNIDLDFNSVKLVEVPEPGTIQISNLNKVGKIQFWNQRGDAFLPFYEMNINGNPALQKEEFLPGIYQVRYFKHPDLPNQKAEVITFSIKSNQKTSIELQK